MSELKPCPGREPLWCESCSYFANPDMGGEGECTLDNQPTWYWNCACGRFHRAQPANEPLTKYEITVVRQLASDGLSDEQIVKALKEM